MAVIYLIVDFEANMGHLYPNGIDEIIQFSSGLYEKNGTSSRIKYFNSYIRPQFGIQKPIRELTGITLDHVEDAPDFQAYVSRLQSNFYESVIFVSFSSHDICYFLENALKYHASTRWIKGYMDLQEMVMYDCHLDQQPSLKKSLSLFGLEFVGKQHNAYYDVLNTIRLFRCIDNKYPSLNRWVYDRKELLQKFNSLIRYDKEGHLIITKSGKKILKKVFFHYKHRDVNFILNSGTMKKILEQNFIDRHDKQYIKVVRKYFDNLLFKQETNRF